MTSAVGVGTAMIPSPSRMSTTPAAFAFAKASSCHQLAGYHSPSFLITSAGGDERVLGEPMRILRILAMSAIAVTVSTIAEADEAQPTGGAAAPAASAETAPRQHPGPH